MTGSPIEARHRLLLLSLMCRLMTVAEGMARTENSEPREVEAQTVTQKTAVVPALVVSLEEEDQDTPNKNQSCERSSSTGCSWPVTANADVTPLFWSFVNVTCRPGFQFESGPPHWTITQCVNNRWSPVPKSCIRISCPPLQSFTDASLNTTRVSYGTRVNVSCEAGKQLMRSISNWIINECQADGTWSAKPSNCLSAAPGPPTVAHSFYGRNGVLAMGLVNDELFVAHLNENHVSVYDSLTLESKRQIPMPGIFRPNNLAVSSSGNYLYVCDLINYRVVSIDLSTNIVTGWSVPLPPHVISVAINGNVLVGTYSASKILEYTSTGTLVREIADGNYLYQAVEPISDGSGPTQMHHPRSLAVDSEGSIFVADVHNNRIQLVDSSLSIARTLPLPHGIILNLPHALCYDESRGRLYVAEYSGQFRVLAFDNVTNIY